MVGLWSLAGATDQAGLAGSSPATRAGWVQPSHMGRAGPSLKKIYKNKKFFKIISKKICDFPKFFTAL